MATAAITVTCLTCQRQSVPAAERPIQSLSGDRFMCGHCGEILRSRAGVIIPEEVESLVSGLIQRAQFRSIGPAAIVNESMHHPLYELKLRRCSLFTDTDECFCTVQWRGVSGEKHRIGQYDRRYRRADVPGHMPRALDIAAGVIDSFDYSKSGQMYVKEQSYRASPCFIRFEREVRTNSSHDVWSGTLVRAELSWTVPDASATIFIPAYSQEDAFNLLQARWNMVGSEAVAHLQLCFNRYVAGMAAKCNAPEGAKEAFLFKISCNPLLMGSALIDDNQLSVGNEAGARYTSLENWWTRVSRDSAGWSKFGYHGCRLLASLQKVDFSLEHLPL